MKLLLILASILFVNYSLISNEIRVGEIYIERNNVFEKNDIDWFFASDFLNKLHWKTNLYLIEDEILFNTDDLIDEEYLLETERNLRSTELFTSVRIFLDSVKYNSYNVTIVTKDRWSLYPALLYGTGGGNSNYGARLEEFNLFGIGTKLSLEGLYRTENEIGIQGTVKLSNKRLFRTEISLESEITANKYRTDQKIKLFQPYRTLDTKTSFGIDFLNSFGDNFLYTNENDFKLMPYLERNGSIFFSKAWSRKDRVFATAYLSASDVNRGALEYEQAFDNTLKLLFQFSSVSQDFYSVKKLNAYYDEDMTVGGYGSATIGRMFDLRRGGGFYYVAGQGERSYYKNNLYLFGQLTGASGFIQSNGIFTYQEFTGTGFYKFNDNIVLATRIRQQTVWNWFALRQLVLDNETGLRGYDANKRIGDNRIIANVEMRFFPDLRFWLFGLSGVAFYDVGTVWNQDQKLHQSQFYNSVGAGIRFHFTKSSNPDHTLRIDFAYNLNENKFGGIVFSSKQLFSAFGNHNFKLPEFFGSEFDYE